MLLESLAQGQADAYLLALGNGAWVERTRALLGLRRAMSQKLLGSISREA